MSRRTAPLHRNVSTRRVRVTALAAIAPVALAAACASATLRASVPDAVTMQDTDARRADRFAAQVDSLRRAAQIPGLALVVLRDTTVILARGFGWADVEAHVPVLPDETLFDIASVTKPIAAVVALRLVERGLLDLDRPMSSFAGFAAFCADARADGPPIFFRDFECTGNAMTLRHVLSMQVNGTPGTRFWYNPISYSWASRPMAEVADVPFSQLVQELVFAPAGMTRSARIHRRLPLQASLAAARALPYHIDSATGLLVRSELPPPQGDGAAGGVIATAMDLARFDIALTTDRLLTPASRQRLWTPGRTPSGDALPYGLGWFVAELDGETLYWHTGLWDGQYSALYLKVPGRRLTLILLANSDGLRWESGLGEAAVERSPFARALLAEFAEMQRP